MTDTGNKMVERVAVEVAVCRQKWGQFHPRYSINLLLRNVSPK